MRRAAVVLFLMLSLCAMAAEPVMLEPTEAPIQIDGDLGDSAWQRATKYETWYETNPGDNIEPKVKTVGWVTYDSQFFYAAVESLDPAPASIRSQLGDHD